ncbi:hypothetical protein NP493_785g01001 [Ridgeia piscesae]|uniref:Uncharacterized protein n=1 Tax=Ridgeia piscesae TaxID=27915 RepID=A0AAD9NLR6_RIDPI|nr:hypothetical protein NP493_785g01001 [Ridgeia piscesae]
MTTPRYGHRSVLVGKHVIVVGGKDGNNKATASTEQFSLTKHQWLTLGDMPEVCDLSAAVSLGQYIYLVGGFSRSCLRYDPATDSWRKLSQPRLEHGNAPAVM